MARSLRDQGPLRSLITQEEIPTASELLTPEDPNFNPHVSQLVKPGQDFERGLQQATSGIEAGQLHREADFAEARGDMDTSSMLREAAVRAEGEAAQYAPRVSSTADVENLGDAIDFAQQSFGQLAPSVAATTAPAIIGGVAGGLVAGPAGAAAGAALAGGTQGFSLEAGEAASSQQGDEFIRNLPVNERIQEQQKKGFQGAAVELAFPTIVGGRLAKSVGKIFKQIGEEGVKQTAKKQSRNVASNVALETGTEAATEGTQTFIGQASLNRLNPNRDQSGDVQEIIDAVVMGGLGGGGISLSTSVPTALKSGLKLKNVTDEPAPTSVSDAKLQQGAVEGAETVEVTTPETTLDAQAATEAGTAEAQPQTFSDADLERKARIRRSTFGTRIPVDTKAEPVLRHAEPEELGGLRELKPFTKGETKGQRRYIRSQPQDVDAFLKAQVERGVISQEVANSATVEPLGQSLKRKGATTQELENEVAGIVRDLMERIETNKKRGDTDMVKGLTSELENLPIDVQRRGETTERGASQVIRKFDRDIEREQKAAGTRKMKKDAKQGDLFPTEQAFPVPVSEFRRHHFGFKVDLDQNMIQQELDLNQNMTRDELLIRALDQYSVVLASDAARGESAASTLDTKKARKRLDASDKKQKAKLQAEGNVIRLRKKNGQTELLDADSLAAVAYEQEGGREAILGGRKNVSKQKEREAAIASGLASQLLREDIDGVVIKDGKGKDKVVRGVEADAALRQWMKDKPGARKAFASRDKKVVGGKGFAPIKPEDQQDFMLESDKRQDIQRKFTKARKALQQDTKGEQTPAQVKQARTEQRKALTGEIKRVRDLLRKAGDLRTKIKEAEDTMDPEFAEPFVKGLKDNADPEVVRLVESRAAHGTARFRVDRLESLSEEIQQLLNEQKAGEPQLTSSKEAGAAQQKFMRTGKPLQKELPAVQENTAEMIEAANKKAERKVRHAEDATGADQVLAVGTPFRGEQSMKKFSRQTSADPQIQNAINGKTREARQRRITEYLNKVLGDRVNVEFKDVTGDDDTAGYFDWKNKVIGLALNMTNAEGVARHEAFHAFFQALGKIDNNRAVYKRLLKAANAPHIRRQLAKLLENHPEALKQLRDPEERAAYMFQFYASGDLKLQPQTFKTFRKWAKSLAKIVGYVSRMDSAEHIFAEFNEGHLKTDAQIAEMIKEQQHTKLAADIASILRPVNEAMRAVLTTATDRLRNTNNQSLTALADLFAHTVKGGGVAGYLSMRAQKEAQFNNRFNDILDRHTDGKKDADKIIEKAMKELQDMKADEDLSPLAKDLRKEFGHIFKYLRDAQNDTKDAPSPNAVQYISGFKKDDQGNPDYGQPIWEPIRRTQRYFPRVWDARTVTDNWAEMKKLLKEESDLTDAQIEDFRRAMEAGDGMLDIGTQNPEFDAAMRAVNERMFKFITPDNAHKFSKFQEQDLTKILTTYARQAAHRGEQTRHFGYDNQKIKSLLADAKEEGATAAELRTADKAIRALEGTLGHETMTPLKKNAMMTAMTVVNFAVLPLALFSSLVDPLGVAVRTGDFKQAGKTFAAGAKQIYADVKGDKTKDQKLAEFLGIVEQEQVLSVIGDSYNSMFANDQLQKMNTRFFKLIGLDSWTKGTRIGAMVASMEYLKEYKNDKKRLAELGLEPGDIRVREDGQIEMRPGKLGQDKARRVQGAIYRMVDESILRPTAAQRPIFMSDMRFMLLGHLKQFTFSFHNTIIKQVAQNINDNLDNQQYVKAMTQLLPLISYVPFMMAADVLRSIVGGRIDDEDDETMGQVLADSIQRAGVLGLGTFAMDAGDDIAYGGAPINTFLGPVIHKGARLVEAGIDPDERFTNQAVRLLPGYAFWKGWLE